MERIRPVWDCPTHRGQAHTEPGKCPECRKKLVKVVPLTELPTVFRCAACKKKFVEAPEVEKHGRWFCPMCGAHRVHAYYVPPAYLEKLRMRKLKRDLPAESTNFEFGRALRQSFDASNAVSQAAFRAQALAERLSKRRPTDGEEYVDKVQFDIGAFNIKAQLVVEMVTVKSLLEEAGLEAFVPEAMTRILAKLGPKPRSK